MADVMDLPPEPLPRDERRRDRPADRSDDRRRDNRDPRDRRDERDDRLSRRDYHDKEERPSTALGGDRRDRGRDYKRRRSPSPPPYRERRASPLRRSPGSYKRSRREDDYGRGNSPRDERFDRRIGTGRGRSNSYSGDERRHPGPFADAGRGGYNDGAYSSYDAAPRREGLMTYKQFISELEDDVSPAEAERRYEEYKNEFIATQKKSFFEQNKQEDWLREKYDPSSLEAAIQRRNEACKAAAREFAVVLESGSLDTSPSFVANGIQEGGVSDEEAEETRRRRNGRGMAKELESGAAPKVPSVSSDPRRTPKDVEQARALVRKLDGEKGIERNVLTNGETDNSGERNLSGGGINPIVIVRGPNQVKGYEGVELLDVLLTYLWRVHYVDYYGSVEYKEQPKVLRHVRTEGKGNDDAALSSDWEKKVDGVWQVRLQGQDPLELMLAKDKVETATIQALEPLVRKIKDEKYGWKYGCGAKNCTKLFHGPEFVHKHLKLKHPELVNEISVKVQEEIYFENYMSDPDAPGSTPVMATQRDRARRPQRFGASEEAGRIGGRGSRDVDRNRGAGRESEKPERARDEELNERENEHSPSNDYQAGSQFDAAGPFEGGRNDTMMFDTFGGPAMRGLPPFGADMGIPPPVLMPVPGAGPLGPFVPAPPEVAMRIWREQGGAGPFHPGVYDGQFDGEGGGGSRGGSRKRMGPTAPGGGILPFPNLRQDSRRALRSYRDLDAPDDEVTVIDYRSL